MQIIAKYFPQLSSTQTQQYALLEPLYHFWNQRINVISRKDIEHLYIRHILHSLSIAAIIRFTPGTVVIDAGTGGGFPGIPLAIMFPESQFILVDSIRKKMHVVEEIIKEAGLTNCETRNLRLEELGDHGDFVVCRAVTEIPILFRWVRKNIRQGGNHLLMNGLLALKGGDLTMELATMNKYATVFNLNEYFDEPFFESKKLVHIPY